MNAKMPEVCVDPHRRAEIRAKGRNGLDYLDVSDDQLTLTVYFLRRAPDTLAKENVVIDGGVRIKGIKVLDLRFCSAENPEEDDCVNLVLDKAGDFSTYTLKLVEVDEAGNPTNRPFSGFDPRYAHLNFSFKAGLPSGLDCRQQSVCAPSASAGPDINYLAKDYASFLQLIQDRLALIMPDWQEQHVPDIGVALIEVLAYVADYLSYYQDAVATEAYLNTARQRISVRRHVRLLDYTMHEGCNARAWIQLTASQDVLKPPPDLSQALFIAGFEGLPGAGTMLLPRDLNAVPASLYQVFEPVGAPAQVYQAHNEIHFYTWGDRQCCLSRGSTSATLQDGAPGSGRALHLQQGDYLLFEEVLGPQTGAAADADKSHRCVVRLTAVSASSDPLNEQPVLEIEWGVTDALPFQLCVSALGPAPSCELIKNVTLARANVLLADHGRWIADESVGAVSLAASTPACESEHNPSPSIVQGAKFSATLQVPWLTFRQEIVANAPASMALMQDPRSALPQVRLRSIAPLPDGSGPLCSFAELQQPALLAERLAATEKDQGTLYLYGRLSKQTLTLLAHFDPRQPIDPALESALANETAGFVRTWLPRADLLKSQSQDFHFVTEIDDNGFAHLRFGDGQLGRAPEAGETFSATYRVGNGVDGNVGAEVIDHIVLADGLVEGLTLTPSNPQPALGGTAPEPVDEVKMFAPGTFLDQLERAITADDYATLAENNPKVQRAAADLVWTGSRYEAHVAIDPLGTDAPDPQLLQEVLLDLEKYRRIGHDLAVVQAQYVPLELAIAAQVVPDYLRAHVKAGLLDAFSNRTLANGQLGFFHPDNLTFGQSIYLSRIISAAQAVPGVMSVEVTTLQRLFAEPDHELENGVLPIAPLEVAQLENDPVFPERGVLRLELRGGR